MSDTPEFLTDPPIDGGGKLDTALEMLRSMRLAGGIFLEARFRAPWAISAKVGPEDCAAFAMTPRHIIAYHYVAEGNCLIKVEGEPPIALGCGDLVVLPRNDHHVLSTDLTLRPVRADDLILAGSDGALARIDHGGDGEAARIYCGFLGNEMEQNAFMTMLPPLLKINATDGEFGAWIESTLRYAAAEAGSRRFAAPVLSRLAELLFLEAVRRYFDSPSSPAGNRLAGLRDPLVVRALSLLHGQLARRWTTDDLARELAASRSAFAERFTRVVGVPPMTYLMLQRFEFAARRLRESAEPIARIAFEVGYESEEAFNRAFRRQFGSPPAAWRREQRAESGTAHRTS